MSGNEERNTWLLWQCLPAASLAKLIQLQWELYGTKLDLMADMYKDVESLEEIDRLMKIPSKYPIGFYSRG